MNSTRNPRIPRILCIPCIPSHPSHKNQSAGIDIWSRQKDWGNKGWCYRKLLEKYNVISIIRCCTHQMSGGWRFLLLELLIQLSDIRNLKEDHLCEDPHWRKASCTVMSKLMKINKRVHNGEKPAARLCRNQWRYTRGSTLEKSHSRVQCVTRALPYNDCICRTMRGSTQVKSCSYAQCVTMIQTQTMQNGWPHSTGLQGPRSFWTK